MLVQVTMSQAKDEAAASSEKVIDELHTQLDRLRQSVTKQVSSITDFTL